MSTFSDTCRVRDAQQEDISAVAGLLTQLNEAEGNKTVCNADGLHRALFGEAREVDVRALVAERGAQVVGALLYYRGYDVLTATYGNHLADFVVDENLRRQGIGKRLFGALAEHTLKERGEWVSLTVLSRNKAARGFYNSLGMTQVAVDFFAIGQRGLMSVATLLQK